jgi:hypothetical protein
MENFTNTQPIANTKMARLRPHKKRERELGNPSSLIHVGRAPRVAATSPPLNLTIPNQDQGPKINQGPKPDFRAGLAKN